MIPAEVRKIAAKGQSFGTLSRWVGTVSLAKPVPESLRGFRPRSRLMSWRRRAQALVKERSRHGDAALAIRQAQALVLRRRGLHFADIAKLLRCSKASAYRHWRRADDKMALCDRHWRCGIVCRVA